MRYTASRLNEACGLLKKSVDLAKGHFIISTVIDERGKLKDNTKTKLIRSLPIIPEIQEALRFTTDETVPFVFSRPDGKPYRKKVWATIGREPKVTGVVPCRLG